MNRNSAPWTVPIISSCGRAEELQDGAPGGGRAAVVTKPAPWAVSAGERAVAVGVEEPVASRVVVVIGASPFRRRRPRRRGRSASSTGLAGEGEEDLVEGGAAEADVVDGDARARRAGARRWPAGSAPPSTGADTRWVSWSVRGGSAATDGEDLGDRGEVGGVAGADLDDVAARPGPSARRACRTAMTRPWSTMTMSRASWSASSRYWVVSSTSVPSATRSRMRVPQLDAAAGVEAGGGLVEQQQPRAADEAGAEVEPPAHAARVGADQPVAGVGRGRAARAPRRLRRRRVGLVEAEQAGDHLEVLAAGHGRLDRGVLAGEADDLAHRLAGRAATSMPATRSVPDVGPQRGWPRR